MVGYHTHCSVCQQTNGLYCENHQVALGLGKRFSYTQLPSLHGFGMDASLLLKLDIFTLMIMALCGYCLGFLT
ncbi:MAG: hypothetical protein ACRDCL_22050, partial [Aeromonas veronii]